MFEFLFKYPPSVFSRGRFVLLGSWPVWVLLIAVLAAAGVLAWLIWRQRERLAASLRGGRAAIVWILQTALVALLLLLLWQPAISVATLRPQQNIVDIVVDNSGSMGVSEDGSTRLDRAKQVLNGGLLDQLRQRFQVRLYSLGKSVNRIEKTDTLRADDPATRIDAGLREIAAESATLPVGAVILLSDGSDNSGGVGRETLDELRARRIPVHTVGFGREQPEHDIEIEDIQIPSRTLAHARLEAQVAISQHGYAGSHAILTIREGGRTLATHQIALKDGRQTESVMFNAGDAGVKDIEAAIAPLPKEENTANNRVTRVVYVDDAARRILYVEGEPRWEFKFLRRAVEDDHQLRIASILRTTENKIYRQGIENPGELEHGFPTSVEELFGYQGIILGSVEAGYFTTAQQSMIKQFVDRRGGGLLFLGGRSSLADGDYNAEPFSDLLPVILPHRKNTFVRDMAEAVLTKPGEQSLICRIEDDPAKNLAHWKILPYLMNYQDSGTAKPGAVVLAEMKAGNRTMPLLVTENYGRGRTAVFATGGSWRWQMQQPVEDMSDETFWRQMLRWLAGTTPDRVTASTPSAVVADDNHVHMRTEVRDTTYLPTSDAHVEAHVVAPDGSTETVALQPSPGETGVYFADWSAPKTGSYVAEITATRGQGDELGKDVIAFRREDGVAENFHRQQNRDLLQKLASETGGRYYTPGEAKSLARDVAYSEAGITERETMDLWDMPAVFFIALLLRSAEWLLRRRWGVV